MNKKELLPDGEVTLYKQSAGLARYQGALVASWCGQMRKYFEHTYGDIWMYWKQNEFALWVFDEAHMHAIAEEFLRKSRDAFPPEFEEDWPKLRARIEETSRETRDLDLKKMPDAELAQWYDKLLEAHRAFWSLGIFIDSLDAGDDQIEIERISSEYSLSPEEVQALVTPHTPSYSFSWEKELFDVKEGARKASDVRDTFYWIRTDYRYFEELTEEYILAESKIASAPEWTSPVPVERDIMSRHGLSSNPLALFQTLTQWRDDRKRTNFIGFYGLLRLLTEIGTRHGIEVPLVRNLMPAEARSLFFDRPDANILRQCDTRFETATFARIKEDGSYRWVDGEEAANAFAALEAHMPKREILELRGMIACRGIVSGRVRVVPDMLSSSASDFKRGDILVTSMTRPEYLPLMKICGGIVTDEGGITSHAAIVSRELKKPCIIGTKHASEYLKDGDMVEVDAERGIVRKL